MSTLAYAALTAKRQDTASTTNTKGKSFTIGQPGMGGWLDAVAALVPAEVLALHGLVVSLTTTNKDGAWKILHPVELRWSFLVLTVFSVGFYWMGLKLAQRKLEGWHLARAVIPGLAFVAWTMLQRATAFDAVLPRMPLVARTLVALGIAVLLWAAARLLASEADVP